LFFFTQLHHHSIPPYFSFSFLLCSSTYFDTILIICWIHQLQAWTEKEIKRKNVVYIFYNYFVHELKSYRKLQELHLMVITPLDVCTSVGWFFLFEKTSSPYFHFFFFLGCLLDVGLSLDLQISKTNTSSFSTCFQIQEPRGLVWKQGLVSCTHYTLPEVGDYVCSYFYKKLKLEIV
jgi:hypothetical protein